MIGRLLDLDKKIGDVQLDTAENSTLPYPYPNPDIHIQGTEKADIVVPGAP